MCRRLRAHLHASGRPPFSIASLINESSHHTRSVKSLVQARWKLAMLALWSGSRCKSYSSGSRNGPTCRLLSSPSHGSGKSPFSIATTYMGWTVSAGLSP